MNSTGSTTPKPRDRRASEAGAPSSDARRRLAGQLLAIALCVAVIAGSALWIYRTQFAAPKFNRDLHEAIGRVMAEETARMLANTGKVVVISIELAGVPELKAQLAAFERTLKLSPGVVLHKKYLLETDGKPKYSFGSGLSGRRYVRIVNKNPDADAFVSFVGAPALAADELKELKTIPRLLAEVRAADKLRQPLEQKVLTVAVVQRFEFPSPVKGTPRTSQEWFDQRFQIITATNHAALPSGKGE